ncbi:MAG TPA: sigma 54-interacting transcriptional regulator [Kofleriaceae bacterium]|nr:sigma 54-interacting transcriptional regulator [Kofleriaceae bacterium]
MPPVTGDLTETVSRTGTASHDTSSDDGAPRLIVACECGRLTVPALRVALSNLQDVTLGRDSRRRLARQGKSAMLTVPDHEISRKHLVVRRQPAGWEVADLASKNGILVNGEPTAITTLNDGDVIEAGGTLLMFREEGGAPDSDVDRDLADETTTPVAFRTVSAELEHRVNQLSKIAIAGVSVLVRGETGTGKELIARAIHEVSGRRGQFVPINCGALPRNLIESELFGHRRGAFSGANEEREGLVRRANGGTLFLDEIAELPEESQVALLRVLQEGEVRPIGASDAVKVDIRIVAATHQDIPARIADGRFRQDLYARLAGFEMVLPALRERREDIGTLIAAILPRITSATDRVSLHRSAARALLRYPWPLNIRELEQALRAAVALADTGEIRVDHLSEAIRTYSPPTVASMRPEDRVLRERVVELLREHGGNVTAVGRAMGKAPIQIRRWCRRMQIELSQFRT